MWLITTIKGQSCSRDFKNLYAAYKTTTLNIRKQKLEEIYGKRGKIQTLTVREVL